MNAGSIKQILEQARASMPNNPQAALALCEQALQSSDEGDNISAHAELHHLKAKLLFRQSKVIDAIGEIKNAIELSKQSGEQNLVSSALNSLGIFLVEIADYPAALDACFQSLRIKEELNDKKGMVATLVNIGGIYNHLENAQQELNVYERALQIADEIKDTTITPYIHLNMGLSCSKTGQFEKGLQYLDKLDEVFLSLGDKNSAIKAGINQGYNLFRSGKAEPALHKYEQSLQLAREIGDISDIIKLLTNIAEVSIAIGELQSVRVDLEEAIELATRHGFKQLLNDAYKVLADYFKYAADYKNAYETLRNYYQLKDELLNIQNMRQLDELRLKYDLERKDKEAQINQLRNIELKGALDKLQDEKNRSDNLLLNILPLEVAEELKTTGTAKARHFDMVTVLLIDIKNFTIISEQLSPEALVGEIDFLFRNFDQIIAKYGVEKIKTIGDAYLCVGGIPIMEPGHAVIVAQAALEISAFMQQLKAERLAAGKMFFEIRMGINSGPVVAGIVGSSKFAYDIWGDTVNTAARMEQHSEVGKINISGRSFELLKEHFNCTYRGKINAKNKGDIDMYFLEGENN